MKSPNENEVKEYLLECLRKKYGTYAGHCGWDLEIINDENSQRIIVSVQTTFSITQTKGGRKCQ